MVLKLPESTPQVLALYSKHLYLDVVHVVTLLTGMLIPGLVATDPTKDAGTLSSSSASQTVSDLPERFGRPRGAVHPSSKAATPVHYSSPSFEVNKQSTILMNTRPKRVRLATAYRN